MTAINYRDIYDDSIIGQITQGSIFNGGKSRLYPENIEVFGIVISPRCDIEQKKVPVYYYLPAIRMIDWVKIEFPSIYIPKLTVDIKDFLKSQLKNNGESETIVDKLKAADVEEALCKHAPKSQLKKNIKEKVDIWKALEVYKKNGGIEDVIKLDKTSTSKNIFDELIKHKNPNYYFMEDKAIGEGYVLRMREINRLTPDMFFRLAKGIDKPLTPNELQNNDLKQLSEGDLYMPLCVVKSPFMEHIMQHFLQQFNKIGIEDTDTEFSEVFVNLIKKEK